jgi:hypothetical protein
MAFTRLDSRAGKRRLRRGLGVMAASGGTIALIMSALAVPASAEQKCTGRPDSNVCLSIDNFNGGYLIHVGIDVHMSLQDAQAILDAPGEPFSARMMGSDPLSDDELFPIVLMGTGASAETGLGADFQIVAARSQLNEDDSFFDDVDEVFARIQLVDPRTGTTRFFNSLQFVRVF